MSEQKMAPYGAWRSPITTVIVAEAGIRLSDLQLDGEDLYWIEMRPAEGGRAVIVRRGADSRMTDVTPTPFNARTRVHEYGGGAFLARDGIVYFAHFDDQRLYRQQGDGEPQPLTPAGALFRYADAVLDRVRERLICVREDHSATDTEAVNTLVGVALGGGANGGGVKGSGVKGGGTKNAGVQAGDDAGRVLVSGSDFYASPRLNPQETQLAWISWNHPQMPWDGTELWVAEIADDGALVSPTRVAGGPDESIVQPEWSPDGVLHFISDRSGWWQIYRRSGGEGGGEGSEIELLTDLEAEFGYPQWVFGLSSYAFESPERLICAFARQGSWHLAGLNLMHRRLEPFALPLAPDQGGPIRARRGKAFFLGGSATVGAAVVEVDTDSREATIRRRADATDIDASFLSSAQAIEFPTTGDRTAHAFFYPPQNRDHVAPPGERPPLLVISHGGPTSAASNTLSLKIQYWTSRGFAVLDVNYGGSTGYGRAYRQRLSGQWGIVDIDDCVAGARYLVEQGEVDGERLAIRGQSAGGYSTLCALTFRDLFKAGASYYGVSDLETLAQETHKFESRYLEGLIGPYPARRDLYVERSPIRFVERISCPMILLQGLEDQVVPPNQAETMVAALEAKGLPVAYVTFEGEQHGFRRAATIIRAFEAELYFYSRIFRFTPDGAIEPVRIKNLPDDGRLHDAQPDDGQPPARRKRIQFWGKDENDDLLVREITDGLKTATVCKADEYHLPEGDYDDGGWVVGDLVDVYDLHARLRCRIHVTGLERVTFGDIPERLWRAEACRDAAHFRQAHRQCWPEYDLSDDFEMVAVYFELVEVLDGPGGG